MNSNLNNGISSNPYNNSITTINSGSITSTLGTTVTTISGGLSTNLGCINTDNNIIEFLDLICYILDIDIKYEDFLKMTNDERKSFIRDIKINKIIK